MQLKYNTSAQIIDSITADLKLIVNPLITLKDSSNYTYKLLNLAKGSSHTLTIEPNYVLRYLAISSTDTFTICINNQFEYQTNTFTWDAGPNRSGFTNLTPVSTIKITNPTGISNSGGVQFSNPTSIEVNYLFIVEGIA